MIKQCTARIVVRNSIAIGDSRNLFVVMMVVVVVEEEAPDPEVETKGILVLTKLGPQPTAR